MKKIIWFALVLLSFASAPDLLAADIGATIYANSCAQCHGRNLEGGAGPSLADNIWINGRPTKDNLIKIITNGVPAKAMPAWKGVLSKQQIEQVAEFLVPKKIEGENEAKAVATGPSALTPTEAQAKMHAANLDDLSKVRLQKGFSITVFAEGIESARAMAIDDNDVVYVGSRKAGKIFALVDTDKDGVADQTFIVAEGLDSPIGITLLNNTLYVAEMSRVIRFDNISATFKNKPAYKIVKDDFPKDRHHGEKIIRASPDGKLFIAIGAPCNVCDKENEPYQKIYSMNPDGSDFKIYARGIRNTVGFAWHPKTKEFWFTDNNRDEMGDNTPSCELNFAPKAGMHFGFPYCHGGSVLDPEFGKNKSCDDYVAPVALLGPHTAPLGLAFYTGKQFPAQYQNQLFVAEHGSWNRSQVIGYRVSLITLAGNKLVSDTPFVEFLQGDTVLGRPVDVAFLSDGSMLISDDQRGRISRVSYQQPAAKK